MSGKQAKRKRQEERQAIPKALREHGDLAKLLRVQMDALRISARAFDEGYEDEARRLATVMVVGALPDVRLQPFSASDWSAESECIGGPEPCTIDGFPSGARWDLEWPGH